MSNKPNREVTRKKKEARLRFTVFMLVSWIFLVSVALFDPSFLRNAILRPLVTPMVVLVPILYAIGIYFDIVDFERITHKAKKDEHKSDDK